jgi:hypothetical protein
MMVHSAAMDSYRVGFAAYHKTARPECGRNFIWRSSKSLSSHSSPRRGRRRMIKLGPLTHERRRSPSSDRGGRCLVTSGGCRVDYASGSCPPDGAGLVRVRPLLPSTHEGRRDRLHDSLDKPWKKQGQRSRTCIAIPSGRPSSSITNHGPDTAYNDSLGSDLISSLYKLEIMTR